MDPSQQAQLQSLGVLQAPPEPDGLAFSGPVAELFAALGGAQAEFGELRRTATAKIQTKASGSYEFSYAPLDELLAAVLPALGKHGLWIGQPVSDGPGGSYVLRTIVAHKSGASMTSTMRLPKGDDVKALGSAITYLRRYSLQATLGLAAEEDDDGSAATGDGYERKPASSSQARKPKPKPAEPAAQPASGDPPPTVEEFDRVVKSIEAAPDGDTLKAIAGAQKLRPWNDAQRDSIRDRIGARQRELKGAA